MDIGSHCAVCGQLDFLPFTCHRCGKVLCAKHRWHECIDGMRDAAAPIASEKKIPAYNSTASRVQTIPRPSSIPNKAIVNSSAGTQTTTTKTQSQTRPSPAKAQPKQQPKSQPSNNGQRLGSSKAPKNERASAALGRLKQLIGGNRPPKKLPSGLTAEEKRTAVGNTSVSQADRVYFKIERQPHEVTDQLTHQTSMRPAKTAVMFFDANTPSGQILDRASKQLALPSARLLDADQNNLDLNKPASELPSRLVLAPKA